MKSNQSFNVVKGIVLGCLVGMPAFAQEVKGGGDECERRILSIRDNVKAWITVGNYQSLKAPNGISLDLYKEYMLNAIAGAKVSCTAKTIVVNKVEKTCVNTTTATGDQSIVCNFNRFMNPKDGSENAGSIEEIQYRLVHHEYAGLAGLELNQGAVESKYFLSNQVSAKLEKVTELKLPIVKKEDEKPSVSGSVYAILTFPNGAKQSLKTKELGSYISLPDVSRITASAARYTPLNGSAGIIVDETWFKTVNNNLMNQGVYPDTESGSLITADGMGHVTGMKIGFYVRRIENYTNGKFVTNDVSFNYLGKRFKSFMREARNIELKDNIIQSFYLRPASGTSESAENVFVMDQQKQKFVFNQNKVVINDDGTVVIRGVAVLDLHNNSLGSTDLVFDDQLNLIKW